MAKHIARGIQVNRDTLAVDLICSVGHKGNFLSENHTLNYFRKECYFPKILDRTNYAGWEKLGRKTIDVRLKEKADEIIKAHNASLPLISVKI